MYRILRKQLIQHSFYSLGAYSISFKRIRYNDPGYIKGPIKSYYEITPINTIPELEILEKIKKNINDPMLIEQIEKKISSLM